jgi:hypothetical protein
VADIPGTRVELTRQRLIAAGAGALALVLLIAVVARACSRDDGVAAPPATAPPATEAPSTTAPPPPPIWPLTGALGDPAVIHTPAVAVKVDNSPQARPHASLNMADLVYELQVEGITRFMEVYHSQVPDRVGPVRSARSSDIDLLAQLGRPLLMWSGGNGGVTGEVHGAHDEGWLVDVGVNSAAGGHYWRDRGRQAPHNLYGNARGIKDQFGMNQDTYPGEILQHAPPGTTPPGAVPAAGVTVNFGLGVVVRYVWDPERKGWDRFQTDQNHGFGQSAFVDEGGQQVAPENVLVLFLDYVPDPVDARSPKAVSVGEGGGMLLTNGTSTPVHWKRESTIDGWHLTNPDNGQAVKLGAGRAWVALPATGQGDATLLDPGEAAGLLAVRA